MDKDFQSSGQSREVSCPKCGRKFKSPIAQGHHVSRVHRLVGNKKFRGRPSRFIPYKGLPPRRLPGSFGTGKGR